MLTTKLIGDDFEADTPFAQLKNFRQHVVSSLPTLPDSARGHLRYLSSDDFLYLWKGTSAGWHKVATASGDFATVAAMEAGDAATYSNAQSYALALSQGFDGKGSVRAATTAALPANTPSGITLTADANGALTVDGITPAIEEEFSVLVKNETDAEKNGIYDLTTQGDGSTPWVLTRRMDANDSAKVTSGMFCWVTEGTTNGNTAWFLSTDDPITLGVTELTFGQFAAVFGLPSSAFANDSVLYSKMQNISVTQRVLGRNTAGAGDPEEVTATQFLDWIGSTRGSIMYKGASGWAIRTPGTAGLPLVSAGSGADPDYSGSLLSLVKASFAAEALSYSGTVDLNFDTNDFKTLTLGGNITFTTSNKGAIKQMQVVITCDGSARTPTFPAWTWLVTAPTSFTASKVSVLSLTATGTTEASVLAVWKEAV